MLQLKTIKIFIYKFMIYNIENEKQLFTKSNWAYTN